MYERITYIYIFLNFVWLFFMCYMHRYKKLFVVQYLELTARASYATILSLSDHVHTCTSISLSRVALTPKHSHHSCEGSRINLKHLTSSTIILCPLLKTNNKISGARPNPSPLHICALSHIYWKRLWIASLKLQNQQQGRELRTWFKNGYCNRKHFEKLCV